MSPITTLAQLILQQLLHSKFHQIFHKLVPLIFSKIQAGRGRGILQNAERRMLVSCIECETGRSIIYDQLISYMPNPNVKG